MKFTIEGPCLEKASICEPILRSLPDWFGIEAAIVHYAGEIDRLPTMLADRNGEVVGFLTLKEHTPDSAEVYAMGIRQEAHRLGIGRALMESAIEWLRLRGIEYLQVKTLGPSHPDKGYAGTRAFYEAVGFRPLEEFKQIWGEDNPCLIMVRKI